MHISACNYFREALFYSPDTLDIGFRYPKTGRPGDAWHGRVEIDVMRPMRWW